MLSDFRFRRGGVSARFLEISILIGVLFVAGCTTNRGVAQFSVTTTSGQLATAIINAVYPQTTLTAANGTAPYTWAITSGALPTGLTLSPSGALSGTPTAFGTFNFTVTVTDSATPTPHTATASLSVLINPALASVVLNPTTVTGGTSSTGTVTLTGAAAAAATVTLSSNNGAAVVPATATVAAGQTSGTFQVTTNAVSASTPATITATYGVAKTAALTVNPPVVSMVTLAQSTVTGGTSTTGTVTLSGPAATGGDVVTLSSTNAAATPQATVTVAAGASTAQFNVTTVTVTTTATGNIQASFNSSSPTAALTVVPAPTITSFTATATTITAGGSTTLTGVFSNGTGSVSNGVGAVTSGTAVTVSPATTTTYTLTVTNAAGTLVTKQATVTVVAAPAITSFTPAAATITAGSSTTLTGVFSNGTGSVDNGVGAVTSGTAVTVSPSATTTYTLTVTNTAGASVTKQATVTVVPAPAITSFVSAAATITAGTSTTLTAVFSNGTGSVDNGVGAVTSATPVTVSPAATTTYTLTVTNAANTSVTKQVTVTVVAAPAITSFTAAAATITAGTSTTLTAVFSNGTGSVDNAVGAVTSGVAVSVSPASTTTYTLTVTNAAGASVTKQATVTVVPAPVITSFTPGAATIVSGSSTTLTAVFSNGTGSVNNGVGSVTSGTPVNITPAATTTYTLTVSNSATTPATVTAMTTVTVNVPPAITTASNATFTIGSNGSFTVRTTGNPTPSLGAVGTLPGTVTFHDNGDGTATISGIPSGSPASYPITITASNGVTPNAVQTFTLNTVLVQAPAITSANSVTFTAGTSGTFTVTTTGSPTPALTKTGSLPAGVNFTDNGNGTATISGSTATVGSSPITITANNGQTPNATQPFTFNVVAAPAITSFTASASPITVGGSTTLTGVFSGGTGSVNNGVGAVTSGTGVSVSPATTTTYTLTVTNAATTPVSVTSNVTVTVDPAPIITSFTATSTTIVSGSSTTLTPVFSNGTGSVNNSVGTVTSGTGVSVSPTVTTTYTLTVTNGAGTKTTSTVTITVDSAPTITSANSAGFTVGTAGSFTVNTTGFPIPALSETLGLPTGVSFHDNGNGTGTLSWTAAVAGGSYGLSFTASNGIGSNAIQSFTLTANSAPAITSAGSTTFTAGTAGSFNVTTTGFPTPALSETLSLPTGVSFVDNHNGTGTLSWTAAVAGGSYGLSFTASNGIGSNASQSFTLTVDAAPVITSANSANATAGVAGSFTVTTTGFPVPTLTQTDTLPTGVSFVDNHNGTGTLSWTTAITAGSDPLSFTASNGIGANATQSFTLNVAVPSCTTNCTLSGTVTVGGQPLGDLTLTLTGPSPATTTTNATTPSNGSYSFTGLTAGNYSLTAPAGYTYSPSTPFAIGLNSDTVQNFTATSTITTSAITGTVSYSGTKTGLLYIRVYATGSCQGNCNGAAAGTSITLTGTPGAYTGSYTVRGLQPVGGGSGGNASGTYNVVAEIDTLNNGSPNASNPNGGTSTPITVNAASVAVPNIALTDPTPPAPVTPSGLTAAAGSTFVLLMYNNNNSSGLMDNNGREIATSYKVYYDTNPSFTSNTSVTFPAHGAHDNNYIKSGLTTGTTYYFKISTLVGATEGTASSTASATTAAGTGTFTVSGHVTFSLPAGVPKATGPLYVGLFDQNAGKIYGQVIPAASLTSPQAYSVTNVPAGTYVAFAIIDMNNNGLIEPSDITNVNNNQGGPPPLTVSGNTTNNVTLTSAVSTMDISTSHQQFNGTNDSYGLSLGLSWGSKRPVALALVSGPNIPVPWDMPIDTNNSLQDPNFPNGAVPTAGDTYQLQYTFSDGSTQTIPSQVTAVLNSFAQNMAMQTTSPGSPTIPLLTWVTPASTPSPYTYYVGLYTVGSGTNVNWNDYGGHNSNGIPSGTTSVLFNADGSANSNGSPITSLPTATNYQWFVGVQDSNGNSSQETTTYSTPGTPLPAVAPYFASSSIPVNGSTTLVFNITNPSSSTAMSGIAFTDNMTGGLSMTGTIQFNSCSGSVVETTSTVLNYSGGSLAAGASCNFAVYVTDTAVETNTNTATNVIDTGNTTGTTSSSATLTVFAGVGAPVVNAYFTSPGSILVGQPTTLNFNIYNNNGGSVTLNSIGFTDSFAGSSLLITQVSGTTIAYNNGCSGTITATNGTNSLSLSGASLAAGSTCTFGVNVTDATPETVNTTPTGITSSPSGAGGGGTTATLTVSGGTAPSITTSNTADFFVGTLQTYDILATGAPTPSIVVTGALPTGLSFTDNGNGSGVLTGTPGAGTAGNYSPLVTASNGVSPNATQTLAVTVTSLQCPLTALGNEGLLSNNSTYVMLFNGFQDADGPSQGAGVFTVNGTGGITGGELDFGTVLNYSGGAYGTPVAPQKATISSTGSCYNLGSDNRGYMVWNLSSGTPITKAFAVRGDGTIGRFIVFSDVNPSPTGTGSRGSGVFMKRTITGPFSLSSLTGSFAVGLNGFNNDNCQSSSCTGSGDGGYQRLAAVGRFTSGGAGSLTGFVFDVAQAHGTPAAEQNVDSVSPTTATYTAPDSFGRGTLSISATSSAIGAFAVDFAYYMIDATHVFLQSIDSTVNGPLFNGEAIGQSGTFSASSLNGNAVFSMTGGDVVNNAYTVIAAGRFNGVGTGANVTTLMDKISNGSVINTGTTAITGGSFTASANGMGSLTISSGQVFSVAMYGTNAGFLLEGTQASPGTSVMSGVMEPQTAPGGGWLASAVSGLFSQANMFPSTTNAKVGVGSLTATPGATNTLSGSSDKSNGGTFCNNNCLQLNMGITATYAVDANGRITVTNTGTGGGSIFGWMRDTTHGALVSPGNSNALTTQIDH
jgi:hypothetical protein